MRRPASLLLLGLLALASLGFAPAPATSSAASGATAQEQIVICVRFRDWTVPVVGVTVERPSERFCIETRDVVVPRPN